MLSVIFVSINWIQCIASTRNKKSRIYGTSDQSVSYDMICLICQICQRVRSVRPWESDLWGRESPWEAVWESDRPLTHTGRCNAFSREISQTAPRMTASPGVRERPIGLPHGLSRTLTASHHKVMWSVWESEVRGHARPPTASHGLTDWPHRSDSQIYEANLWGRESPIGLYRVKQCV